MQAWLKDGCERCAAAAAFYACMLPLIPSQSLTGHQLPRVVQGPGGGTVVASGDVRQATLRSRWLGLRASCGWGAPGGFGPGVHGGTLGLSTLSFLFPLMDRHDSGDCVNTGSPRAVPGAAWHQLSS